MQLDFFFFYAGIPKGYNSESQREPMRLPGVRVGSGKGNQNRTSVFLLPLRAAHNRLQVLFY